MIPIFRECWQEPLGTFPGGIACHLQRVIKIYGWNSLPGFPSAIRQAGFLPMCGCRVPGPVPLSAVLELRSAATFAPRPAVRPLGHVSLIKLTPPFGCGARRNGGLPLALHPLPFFFFSPFSRASEPAPPGLCSLRTAHPALSSSSSGICPRPPRQTSGASRISRDHVSR